METPVRWPLTGVIGVICRQAQFLVIRRSQLVRAPGMLCFPGGGLENGENEEFAVRRELNEELGITDAVPIKRLWRSSTPRGVQLSWWQTRIAEGTTFTMNPDEVAEVMWLGADQILELPDVLESNRKFLQQLVLGKIQLVEDE